MTRKETSSQQSRIQLICSGQAKKLELDYNLLMCYGIKSLPIFRQTVAIRLILHFKKIGNPWFCLYFQHRLIASYVAFYHRIKLM